MSDEVDVAVVAAAKLVLVAMQPPAGDTSNTFADVVGGITAAAIQKNAG